VAVGVQADARSAIKERINTKTDFFSFMGSFTPEKPQPILAQGFHVP
jgi:hypothetical protein